jgi:asparagine synthase (glutamine-hydrolysing)
VSLLPLFQDRAGRRSADPPALAGPAPVVDLDALALLLAPPALPGEFMPRSPWKGVERVPAGLPQPLPGSPARAFARAVETLTADAEVIGVLASGGLDSLAVLVHAVRAAGGRRVIAFTTDLTDDAGGSAAAVVRRLPAALELPVELTVLDPARDRAEPVWSPAGPRLDALPEANAAAAERAVELGCGVLLSGDGADELLGVPRYATAAVAARRGVRAAARYVADAASSGPGLAGEVAGAVAGLLPRGVRARTYWAANWPAWCDPVAPAVPAEPYRSAATAWARRWVDAQVAAHAAAGRSWVQADAHDAAFPREAIPPAGPVAEASPFLRETFLPAALGLPLGDRYHPGLPSAYLRCKAQVVRLLPAAALPVLPQRKQYFKTALAQASVSGRRAPRCVAAGLLDGDVLAAETDPAVLLVVAALERWPAGAEKKAAAVSGA